MATNLLTGETIEEEQPVNLLTGEPILPEAPVNLLTGQPIVPEEPINLLTGQPITEAPQVTNLITGQPISPATLPTPSPATQLPQAPVAGPERGIPAERISPSSFLGRLASFRLAPPAPGISGVAEVGQRLISAASSVWTEFVKGITFDLIDPAEIIPELEELNNRFSKNIPTDEDNPLIDRIATRIKNDPNILGKLPAKLTGELLSIGKVSRAVTAVRGVPTTIRKVIANAAITGGVVGSISDPGEKETLTEELGARTKNAVTTAALFAGTAGVVTGVDKLLRLRKVKSLEEFRKSFHELFIKRRNLPDTAQTRQTSDQVVDDVMERAGGFDRIKRSHIKEAIARTKRGLEVKLPGIEPPPVKDFKFKDTKFERRFKAAKGVPKESTLQRAKDLGASLKRKATREFEHLPKTAEFAPLRFDLLRLSKQKGVASDKAIRAMSAITKDLTQPEYDLFTRKVVMSDLAQEASANRQLPFGLTPESLNQELPALDTAIEEAPKVQDALIKRRVITDEIRNQYIASMKSIGLNIGDRLNNEDYFRHQVLEHMNNRALYGTGEKLKTPAGRGFLRQREGSEADINTDYLQAEHEVLAQMIHDVQIGETYRRISGNYNIADQVKASAKEQGIADWHDAIPEGFVTHQPREGNIFYMANAIPENIAEALFDSELGEIGITKDNIKRIMAVGRQRSEFVVKKEVADTLNNLQIKPSQNIISRANKEILKKWKIWVLGSPRRVFKYNMRNVTGDADAAFVGNPSTFKKSSQATKELWNLYFGDGEIPPDLQDWFDRGGMQTTMQAQEIGDINRLSAFKNIRDPEANPESIPVKAWKGYWNRTRAFTDFRESILRYSAYLDYLEQIQKSPSGQPNNFGASIPAEVQGLSDPKDKAFLLANDLLGAYDRVSVFGKALREHIAPFWSWKEVNFKRYIQFAKNAVNDGKAAEAVGRKAVTTAIKAPFVAARIGKFLIKATAFWSMLQAWNHSMYPEEEESLSEREQSRPHIILGRDDEGNVISFNRIGALGDFLEWFGLDAAPRHVSDWLRGKRTLKEIANDMAQAGPNVIAQSITPLAKIPPEVATRRALYPNIFEPRTIRDRGAHVAAGLGLTDEYAAIFGKPSRGYAKSLTQALIYKTDPLMAAYSSISEEKFRFLKRIGKFGEGFWLTPRGDALYNYKLSLKFRDKEAADKYLKEYVALGGTEKGMQTSLNRMHPLGGLSRADRVEFETSLDEEDKQKLKLAIQFYKESLIGRPTIE
jgi:hypothetical protein